ncbi:DNA polymerase III subunit gamma/tau [Pandoraea apista]|uniref:DNA polymerase III subunit gamma/tau n=1 Tax=Pandoraea apista TaxID=93218 RepID=A0ABX9ZVR0_9BURK|nr:DNA polymerase III subunit gamma/tau [Pandoraea apista]PTE03013.1 DNA polymerase III subunit gamma/tau [Pandoraea apista]RRJ35166.1 DNA polymerase III subunit gamma/tau [Pandoraea apista]RRJ81593.1 DNA polymerase III subunit gamma/tau [Pandoraea apista]RSD18940.1 DNA polymerase III subunit gamma/tau [Pandoraea apista]RSD23417.1 DNA polymerase III subunit gamma/tau [Pandoraea apista]
MTYQVLARKWRPKGFSTLVGQEHVVRALTHALEQQRLHHAYLFTGTRGVGKTTLSRILAKALNCETGITAQPCGVCKACRAIDEGRFVDYVEMDAASNRGVDEMTSLLEKAVYAPADARFKVYMIDEVHMLTGHAFNAMLKTLEEPPAHVKFILATTDPQKIPVTVLSRCLQFNLKQMPAGHIVSHLTNILGEEGIESEPQALRLLAKAAGGSMRDALSLTDQAIAYAAGPLSETAVRGMLGAIDQSVLVRLLDALKDESRTDLLAVADEMAERSFSFAAGLQDLGSLLHKIALAQYAPQAVSDDWPEAADVRRLAEALSPEAVQLYYQIATRARGELGLAPDEYTGFSMALLRMAAFTPLLAGGTLAEPPTPQATGAARALAPAAAPSRAPMSEPSRAAAPPAATPAQPEVRRAPAARTSAPTDGAPMSPARAALAALNAGRKGTAGRTGSGAASANRGSASRASDDAPAGADPEPEPAGSTAPAPAPAAPPRACVYREADGVAPVFTGEWPALAAELPARGLAQQLAFQSELTEVAGRALHLRVPLRQLADAATTDKLRQVLSEHLGVEVQLQVELGQVGTTAASLAAEAAAARQRAAEQAIADDPLVRELIDEFDAQILPGSIRPVQ